MWKLEENVMEALKNYSIIELKTFIDAIEMVIEKAPSGSNDKQRMLSTERVAKDLLYAKISIFLVGM